MAENNNSIQLTGDVAVFIAIICIIVTVAYCVVTYGQYEGCIYAPVNTTCIKPWWMSIL